MLAFINVFAVKSIWRIRLNEKIFDFRVLALNIFVTSDVLRVFHHHFWWLLTVRLLYRIIQYAIFKEHCWKTLTFASERSKQVSRSRIFSEYPSLFPASHPFPSKLVTSFCLSTDSAALSNYLRGDGGIRTLDPLLARQVLSQLSYTPIRESDSRTTGSVANHSGKIKYSFHSCLISFLLVIFCSFIP